MAGDLAEDQGGPGGLCGRFITLVMSLRAVWARGLPLGGGVIKGPLLQKSIEVNPPVQGRLLLLNFQELELLHLTFGRCHTIFEGGTNSTKKPQKTTNNYKY